VPSGCVCARDRASSGSDPAQDGCHHLVQRRGSDDLVVGYPAEARLNGRDVVEHPVAYWLGGGRWQEIFGLTPSQLSGPARIVTAAVPTWLQFAGGLV
jgi:hypothetical protein